MLHATPLTVRSLASGVFTPALQGLWQLGQQLPAGSLLPPQLACHHLQPHGGARSQLLSIRLADGLKSGLSAVQRGMTVHSRACLPAQLPHPATACPFRLLHCADCHSVAGGGAGELDCYHSSDCRAAVLDVAETLLCLAFRQSVAEPTWLNSC